MNFNKNALNIPPIESPFFEEWVAAKKNVPQNWVTWARDLHEKGYAVIEKAIDTDLIDKLVDSIKHKYPDKAGVEPTRYLDMWTENEHVKTVALQKDILDFLKFLYEREPIPFQTLNFKYGTQQCLHSDLIHFSTLPRRYMCGIWVAFEDLDANNGPLLYCEGSHKLPDFNYHQLGIPFTGQNYDYYNMYEEFVKELVKAKKLEPKELHIKKGDVMIWSAALLHGGKAILGEGRTRWSQVTHVYFDDCCYYTPMWSEESSGKLYVRHSMTNIATGQIVKNKVKGKEVDLLKGDNERYWIVDSGFMPTLKNMLRLAFKGKK
jgi:ectoine hydroxylase-related dioxygenase (phytanoyl-CoA dioxygenase family)